MNKLRLCLCLLLTTLLSSSCGKLSNLPGEAVIERRPAPAKRLLRPLEALKAYNPDTEGEAVYQINLSWSDLSALDLSDRMDDLLYVDFSSATRWPGSAKLPEGFDPQRIMELGRSPGLNLRSIHQRGITGRGVGVAVIDQPLLVEHQEYTDRLHLYEEIGIPPFMEASMHGPAVASLAVGETIGAAPEADLYYIGLLPFKILGPRKRDFRNYAKAVQRIVKVNRELPPGREIRVISLSIGWDPQEKGYAEMEAAVQAAKEAGIFVISSNLRKTYGFKYQGLGRSPLADPDDFESYAPGLWWAKPFYRGEWETDRLLVPMDSRTAAAESGAKDYTFFRAGGWSWVSPYLAGLYALAAQVDPTITPERFWSAAMETGRTITLKQEGEAIPFGPILDPVALIDKLEGE